MNQHTCNWTDERVETMSRLWSAGHSAAEIARTIGGVSRCAVIGKLHRMGRRRREPVVASGRPPRRSAFALAEFDPVIRRAVAAWTNEISKTQASNREGEGKDD